jgi:hypothetical protein
MAARARRTLLVLALPSLVLLSAPAQAVCLKTVCVDTLPIGPGGDGGVLCEYVKTSAPPPSDWTGDPNSPAPYIFTRTQAWGDGPPHAYGQDWNERACAPACPIDPSHANAGCHPFVEGDVTFP